MERKDLHKSLDAVQGAMGTSGEGKAFALSGKPSGAKGDYGFGGTFIPSAGTR